MPFSPNLLCRFLLVIGLVSLPGLPLFAHSISTIPGGARSLTPGRYTLTVKLDKPRWAKDGVEAELIIPAGLTGPAPTVVFIHGNSRDFQFYKSAANFLVGAAAVKKAIVISIQNWWPLSMDKLEATEDTRRALNLLLHRLVDAGIVQGNKVYVSGFSAGGLAAVSAFVQGIDHFRDEAYKVKFAASWKALIAASKKSVEDYYYNIKNPGKEAGFFPYAGLISFKGNFYMKYFHVDPILNDNETRKHMAVLTWDKKIVLIVGGDKEAKDVQKEVPICRDFLRRVLGMRLDYHEFGDEGHNIDKSNQDLLWAVVP